MALDEADLDALVSAAALILDDAAYPFIAGHRAVETKGHGVPEVVHAVSRQGGRLRLRSTFSRLVSSSLTIGSGGSGQLTTKLREKLVGIQRGTIPDTHGWVMRLD